MTTINSDLLNFVADVIEETQRFDLSTYAVDIVTRSHVEKGSRILVDCGTTACVCGWTNALASSDEQNFNPSDEGNAAKLLGLTHNQAHALFYGRESVWGSVVDVDWDEESAMDVATADDAAAVLRGIANGTIVIPA